MNLIDMDKLRKDLMAMGDNISRYEVFNTIWDQPLVKAVPKEKIDKLIELVEQMRDGDFDYMNCTHCYTEGNRDACDTFLRLLKEACDGD